MQRRLYEIRRFVTRHFWWPLAQFVQVVHPAPLLCGVIIFLLFAFTGQIHELYLLYLEPPYDIWRGWQLAFAAGALTLLSTALYLLNYSLSDVSIEIVWSQHRDVDRDSKLRACRKFAGLLAAALPWAGVWVGVLFAGETAEKNIAQIEKAKSLGGSFQESETIEALAAVLKGLNWTLVVIAVCGAAALAFLHLSRRNARIRYSALALIGLLFVAAVVAPSFLGSPKSVQAGVDIFRRIGPLAMIILDVLLVLACVAVLILLSREVGIPVVALVVVIALMALPLGQAGIVMLLALLFLAVAVLALLSWRWKLFALSAVLVGFSVGFLLQLRGSNQQEKSVAQPAPDLAEAYDKWLIARTAAREAYKNAKNGKPYPVFIIAAEGGGIYAASAAAAFLSRLQEYCPSFAQHVFAISGVSGGAVGASVFHSIVRDEQIKTTECKPPDAAAREKISKKSSKAIQADHLSPLLGFIVADMLGIYDRARGLEQSLVSSASVLGTLFDGHWQADKAAPALVLNATWAENGHRVAFAPFTFGTAIKDLKGKVLHSFSDNYFRDHTLRNTTIAGAAVVSARFPAILPAFTIVNGTNHWSFVDGGYKDSSGALTALDIFNLIRAADPEEKAVAPRLILLTSTRSEFDPEKVHGMGVPNLFAPAITLLSVRDRLAEDAVSRTVTAIAAGATPSRLGVDDSNPKLVELNQQAFIFSLGWTISRSTHAIVSIQMGYPELCPNPKSESKDDAGKDGEKDKGHEEYIWVETLKRNSCVMKSVVQLLSLHEQTAH
jgi:hypothetical protein